MKSDDAYQHAWTLANRNPDGSVIESSLVEMLAECVDFDANKARLGLAQRIVARRKRPGQTAPAGSVVFPGMEHYAYEPSRLLADDKGNVIENERARIEFKVAEAKRAQADVQRAAERAAREQGEAGHFAVWTAAQYAAGRDPGEITWDACVRETGLWKDDEPAEAFDDAHDLDDDEGVPAVTR